MKVSPTFLRNLRALIAPTNADDPSLPYGHGGGKILEPGSDDFNKFLELLHRVDDDKECPTDSESLFHDPYAGASEYTAAELYHRASFTLTGQFPSPEEYQELIDNDVFDETDYLDKLSTDQNDTANILTANTNADRDLSTGNTTDSDTNTI